ncbi:Ig-like domain-containing protein [Listeria kieliensis]|uniref:Bacterial Ig domain-containing protein n=1 Tax=Listeria kieliensis TaxID=1621700 RepID=A0A3D8TQ24_9LIST|nr:Ig-like domain-containing protein [Listeria kieliensis]RDX00797.1 hypothetical protein UR08_07390 [Listeria kieliensis]
MIKKKKVFKWLMASLIFASVLVGSQVSQTASAQGYDNASPDCLFPSWRPVHKPLRINQLSDQQNVITGSATPYWTVTAVINGNIFSSKVDQRGNVYINLGRSFPAGTAVTVYQLDKNGNITDTIQTTISGIVRPTINPPLVSPLYTNESSVRGSVNAPNVRIVINGQSFYGAVDPYTNLFNVQLGRTFPAGTRVDVYGEKDGQLGPVSTIFVEARNIYVETPKLNRVKSTDTVVTGTSNEPLVEIQIDNATYKIQPDANTRQFRLNLGHTLPVGKKISAHALKDGQQSETTTIYVEQGAVLAPPKLNKLTSTEKVLTGESSAETVFVLFEGDGHYTATPDPVTHKFSIQLDKTYPAGTLVSAYGVGSGVVSGTTTMRVTEGKVSLKAPLMNTVTTEDTMISGTADPNTTIKLNISVDSYETKVDSQGNFKILLDHPYPVDSLISAYSTNGKEKSPVTNAKVIQGSFKLGVNMITDTDRILTGMALPNSKIKVQIGNRVYEGQASALGTFVIQMSQSYKAGQNIEITATDPVSGRTESKVIIVYPGSPSVNTILPGASAVSGQVSPNAFVVVQVGGQNYSGIANAAGYFLIAINPNDVVVGAELTVTQISNNIESFPTRITIGR